MTMTVALSIKILGVYKAQRYGLRRLVISAGEEIARSDPGFTLSISEMKRSAEIFPYTPVLAAPGLVISEHLVCTGRMPSREEILEWLEAARAYSLTSQDQPV
jgi:hypothetical protein